MMRNGFSDDKTKFDNAQITNNLKVLVIMLGQKKVTVVLCDGAQWIVTDAKSIGYKKVEGCVNKANLLEVMRD